jgi:hypothetical protein
LDSRRANAAICWLILASSCLVSWSLLAERLERAKSECAKGWKRASTPHRCSRPAGAAARRQGGGAMDGLGLGEALPRAAIAAGGQGRLRRAGRAAAQAALARRPTLEGDPVDGGDIDVGGALVFEEERRLAAHAAGSSRGVAPGLGQLRQLLRQNGRHGRRSGESGGGGGGAPREPFTPCSQAAASVARRGLVRPACCPRVVECKAAGGDAAFVLLRRRPR